MAQTAPSESVRVAPLDRVEENEENDEAARRRLTQVLNGKESSGSRELSSPPCRSCILQEIPPALPTPRAMASGKDPDQLKLLPQCLLTPVAIAPTQRAQTQSTERGLHRCGCGIWREMRCRMQVRFHLSATINVFEKSSAQAK